MGMMMSSTPPFDGGEFLDPALLERYWLGASPPEEVAYIEAWFEQYPDRRAWYEQMRGGMKADGWIRLSTCEVSARIAAIERAIGKTSIAPNTMRPATGRVPTLGIPTFGKRSATPSLPWQRRVWYGIAAAVVCSLMFMMGRWMPASVFTRQHPVATTVYTTRPGERANITLPDGSAVVLNVASRLEVPTNFGATHRTLRLSGEALFTVTRHTGSPFTVIADKTTTHVLGTMFVVRRYSTDTTTTVAVREGKVAVQSAVVTARQQANVDQQGAVHVSPASQAQFTFANGVLTFDGVLLKDAITELDRWYDADIRIEDPALAMHRLRGTCTTGSLTDLSSILELALNVRVVRDGRTLTLYPKNP
jgi:ferric-dicitrate binding protein FerR (iron transport regulator)